MTEQPENVIVLAELRSGREEAALREQLEAGTIDGDARLVLMLVRECHDLDDIVSVLRTLSYNGVRLGELETDPMVLAGWAKKFRGPRGCGSEQ